MQKAIRINPHHAWAHCNLGDLLYYVYKDYDAAVSQCAALRIINSIIPC